MSEVKYDNLGDALKGAGRKIETALMPVANQMTSFLTDAMGKIDFGGIGQGLANGITEAVNFVKPIIQPLIGPIQQLFSGMINSDFASPLQALSGLQGPLVSMSQSLAPLISGFGQLAQQVFPVFAQVGQTVAGALANLVTSLSPLVTSLLPPLGSLINLVGQAFIGLVNMVMPPITGLINFLMPAFQGILTILQNVIDFVTNIFTANWSAAWQNVTNIFGTIWGGIVGLAKAPINGVISIINSAIGAINSISVSIPDWVPLVGGQTLGFNIPQIPMLATGGTIEEPMLAVVGDAPETIVPHGNTPRNRALLGEAAAGVGASIGGTVVNFNVTITGGSADEVRQGILDAEDEFERRMDAYFAKKARLSFA